jgi:hypothetical protein
MYFVGRGVHAITFRHKWIALAARRERKVISSRDGVEKRMAAEEIAG